VSFIGIQISKTEHSSHFRLLFEENEKKEYCKFFGNFAFSLWNLHPGDV
jgi:hypothetical protein